MLQILVLFSEKFYRLDLKKIPVTSMWGKGQYAVAMR